MSATQLKSAFWYKTHKLNELRAQADLLRVDLDKSLAIAEIWPDAFDHGPCKSKTTGNPCTQLVFTLTLGNGTTYTRPLEDVPLILWSESVKQDILSRGVDARAVYRHAVTNRIK